MDYSKVTSAITKDPTLGNTYFMDSLREVVDFNEKNKPLFKNLNEVAETFFDALRRIINSGNLESEQFKDVNILLSSFDNVVKELGREIERKNLLKKIHENSPEGKRAIHLQNTIFTDFQKAKEFVLSNGWAKKV